MKILVTGSDGFIGKNLRVYLSERKEIDVVAKRKTPLCTLVTRTRRVTVALR